MTELFDNNQEMALQVPKALIPNLMVFSDIIQSLRALIAQEIPDDQL